MQQVLKTPWLGTTCLLPPLWKAQFSPHKLSLSLFLFRSLLLNCPFISRSRSMRRREEKNMCHLWLLCATQLLYYSVRWHSFLLACYTCDAPALMNDQQRPCNFTVALRHSNRSSFDVCVFDLNVSREPLFFRLFEKMPKFSSQRDDW